MAEVDDWRRRADQIVRLSQAHGAHSREARVAIHAAEQLFEHNNPEFVKGLARMIRLPVTIDEFVGSKDFLAGVDFEIWPALLPDLRAMNPDVLIGEEAVHEALLGGATGTGKTVLSSATTAYQGYVACCFRQPQKLFGLSPMTPMIFIMLSVTPTLTKRVIYEPFRRMFIGMPFVQRFLQWNKYKDATLELSNGVQFIPAGASLQALLGQAICGSIIDEANFMAVIENSKQVAGPQGMGGKYDQAEVVYTNISRRRKRSFTTRGISIGVLCVASSTRYEGDFLDRRIDQVRDFKEPHVVSFRRKQYEVNPRFADQPWDTFRVLVGNKDFATRVLEAHEEAGAHYPENATVLDVPLPYRPDFLKDPEAALRDVAGMATAAITPFFRQRHKIIDGMARAAENNVLGIVKSDEVDLSEGMPEWLPDAMPKQSLRDRPHFVHVDLSRSKDRCGVAVVRLDGFMNVPVQGEEGTTFAVLPKFTVVLALGIQPSAMHQIQIAELRSWVLQLKTLFGFNIYSFTFDGFDSHESIQLLSKSGIHSETVSADTSAKPYENFRETLYQDRIDIVPDAHLLRTELSTVEWYPDRNTKQIDHPPRGTKDVADAVVCATYFALNSRPVRSQVELVRQVGSESPERVRRGGQRIDRKRKVRRSK